MAIYNGRKMRRRRTAAERWELWRPWVIAGEVAALAVILWWSARLLGMA